MNNVKSDQDIRPAQVAAGSLSINHTQSRGHFAESRPTEASTDDNTTDSFQHIPTETIEQSDDTFPFTNNINLDWSTSDIANWPEFLQILDLSDQYLMDG